MIIKNNIKIIAVFILVVFVYLVLSFLGIIKKCSDMNICDSWRCKKVIESYPCDRNNNKENIACPEALIMKCETKFLR